uniref:Uncharacterized protein n=1 Tax=uncultured SAR11 cluster alpha proteobacterium H17925_45G17 TaxID=715038 RepID=E7CA30_9PROT|nr:hypothetical protein [uncultured SAR11 cluster alpha proteobacterium H17925_45G17]
MLSLANSVSTTGSHQPSWCAVKEPATLESLSKCNSLTSLANIVLPKTLVILDIGTGMLEDYLAELA